LPFYGIAISVLDISVLEPLQKKKRTVAAKIQELFDCNVLNLGWDDFGVGYRRTRQISFWGISLEEKWRKSCF
jgi:predicted pore-forming effector associated with SMODS systems